VVWQCTDGWSIALQYADGSWELTKGALDAFLARLDANRQRAAERYGEIHRQLMSFFSSRGVIDPDHWVDLTLDRAIRKSWEEGSEIRDVFRYIWGIARRARIEALRGKLLNVGLESAPELLSVSPEPDSTELDFVTRLDWFHGCRGLSSEDRRLVIAWYSRSGTPKADYKRQLAREAGISVGALRVRAFRLRERIRCMAEEAGIHVGHSR
jgi:DNA-directed RNA polymerase specialized sigma24 family protein